MECIGAIAGPIAEYTVEPFGRQVGFIIHFKSNRDQLKTRVEKLIVAKQSLSEEVEVMERRGGKIPQEVLSWLENVEKITARTDELLKDDQDDETGGRQAKLKCFLGLCPNPKTRHRLSRNISKNLLPYVDELIDEKSRLSPIRYVKKPPEECDDDDDYERFESREATFDDIMGELQNPNIKRIGVHGIGGVGKTTIMEQVDRQARAKKLFDDVILIRDVKKPDPEAIQKKIVEKLDMQINDNESESIDGRARRLRGRIQGKNVLVILDDVWERIDFKSVGLPDVATCKILLTSRSKAILSSMDMHRYHNLHVLDNDEAWVLFESKAGDVVKNNGAIREKAKQIAEWCKGLPVLIVTIASALKINHQVQPWKAALTSLKKGCDNKELTERAYMGIEWSYDQLDEKEQRLQTLFLLCAATIKVGNKIILADLLNYSMGLGFFREDFTIEEAGNELFTRIEKLKDSSLLIDSGDSTYVRMHDIVKYVANWQIAFRKHHKLTSVVDGDDEGELKEWPEKDFLDKCTSISFPRGSNTLMLPDVLQCPALKMFIFKGDNLSKISPKLFEEAKELTVLALESMKLQPLPSSFGILKKMQTLCLEQCELEDVTLVGELSNLKVLSFVGSKFTHLPQEIGKLTRLRLLDLSRCYPLQVVTRGVLSSLRRLEDLRMDNFYSWETEDAGNNASVLELKELSRLVTLRIQIPKPIILPADLFSNCKLERFYVSIGGEKNEYVPYWVDITHNTLRIVDDIQLDKGIKLLLKKCEDLYLDGTTYGVKSPHDHPLDAEDFRQVKLLSLSGIYIVQRKVEFPNLSTLEVNRCNWLKYLFTSSMARSLVELKRLKVKSCEILEEIVLSTKEDGEENMANVFTKLESLTLYKLPKFGVHHSLFNEKVVFPNLTTLEVNECDRLKYLFTSSMARSLVELKRLEVESCGILEEIVLSTKEDGEENMTNVFTKLESLTLQKLPKLGRFCRSSTYIEFRSLQKLKLNDCYHLESFVSEPMSSEEKHAAEKLDVERKIDEQLIRGEEENGDGSESEDNPESDRTGVRHSLFNEKVAFPSLERLKIEGLKMLNTIWDDQIAHPAGSFCRLVYVRVWNCPKLINVFPRSIQGRLAALETIHIFQCKSIQVVFESKDTTVVDVEDAHIVETSAPREPFVNCHKLESVSVRECESLKYIFSATVARGGLVQLREFNGISEASPPPQFVFPKVTYLELTSLDEFKSLYPGRHTSRWPSLKELIIDIKCYNREFWQESFPELERLTLFNWRNEERGPSSADFFPKLKSISFAHCRVFTQQSTRLFLEEFRNQLETITLYCGDDEMLVDDGEIHPATTFHHFRSLNLYDMPNLLHLENPTSRSADTGAADPVFPNLTSLQLLGCDKLTSLESSAKSFRHLTTLTVSRCHQLKYLFPYSVAKSLEQLTALEVRTCPELEVIIATDIDDDDAGKDEIVHLNWRLQSLNLYYLPKLQGFVSGNRIIKVPSLVNVHIIYCPVNLKVSPDGVVQVTEVPHVQLQ